MKKKTGALTGILGTLIICLLCGLNRTFASKPETELPTSPAATAASLPTDTAPAPAVEAATATKSASAIPSILPVDVTGNLEEKGFTCSEVEEQQGYYVRDCEKNRMFVTVYGREVLSVDFIDAITLEGNGADFLAFIATIPFVENSELQQQARSWVEENSGSKETSTTINGVYFLLQSQSDTARLQIGELK
jgi:hypothetical protein